MSMQPVSPAQPIAPWIGGKRNLAKRLTAMIDQIDCETYVEPFVGMGGIFLRRTRRPRCEVVDRPLQTRAQAAHGVARVDQAAQVFFLLAQSLFFRLQLGVNLL